MLLTISFATIVMLIFAIVSWNNTPNIVGSEPYTVQYGDTLWEIATMSNGYDHMDTRDIIHDIKELSDCTSDINYGQIVQIPIYEED
jgi:hypothetical protein